ncbi:hypothetical protein EON64_15720, partial [archaeon]
MALYHLFFFVLCYACILPYWCLIILSVITIDTFARLHKTHTHTACVGNGTVVDGLIHDGLWDIYNNQHMGMCGEACATQFNISRQEQDAFAVSSYERAGAAW